MSNKSTIHRTSVRKMASFDDTFASRRVRDGLPGLHARDRSAVGEAPFTDVPDILLGK